MLETRALTFAAMSDRELRRQIDHAVSKAMVDRDFARLLLSDPTIAVEERGCSLQQYKKLARIRATTLVDFAEQAEALFWIVAPRTPSVGEALPLAAAR